MTEAVAHLVELLGVYTARLSDLSHNPVGLLLLGVLLLYLAFALLWLFIERRSFS